MKNITCSALLTILLATSSYTQAISSVPGGETAIPSDGEDPIIHLGGDGFGGYNPNNNTIYNGTVNAVYYNNCTGSNGVGINAIMRMERKDESSLNISSPSNPYSRDKLWISCGEQINRSISYRARGSDFQLSSVNIQTSYVDNWRTNQRVSTSQNYNNWSLDGTTCRITYTGQNPPNPTISCSKL